MNVISISLGLPLKMSWKWYNAVIGISKKQPFIVKTCSEDFVSMKMTTP